MAAARARARVLRAEGPKAALARAAVAREAIATGAGSIVIVADVAAELLLLKCRAGRLRIKVEVRGHGAMVHCRCRERYSRPPVSATNL